MKKKNQIKRGEKARETGENKAKCTGEKNIATRGTERRNNFRRLANFYGRSKKLEYWGEVVILTARMMGCLP